MNSHAWRWTARYLNSSLGLSLDSFRLPILCGAFLGLFGLSGGCATQPDLLKLQKKLNYEREQTARQAEETRQSFVDMNAAFESELSRVRAIAAELRGSLADVREVELGRVIGSTEENKKAVEDLRRKLDKASATFQRADTGRQQLQRKERDHVRAALADQKTTIAALQSSFTDVQGMSAAQSLVVDDFGEFLGKRIEALEKHRARLDKRTAGLIDKQAVDGAALRASLNEQRDSLAGFEEALELLGKQLATQVDAQGSQQDARIQALLTQVQRMKGWVETRTQELADQQVTDVAGTATQLEEIRTSLAGFKVAFEQLGERLGTRVNAQSSQEDERIQALSAQVQRMQGWVEIRTQELAEQDATDMEMTALRVDELRRSLVGFETALLNMGEQLAAQQGEQGNQQDQRLDGMTEQMAQLQAAQRAIQTWVEARITELDTNQKQFQGVREAVVKMDTRGIATITRVNELTRLVDELTTRAQRAR